MEIRGEVKAGNPEVVCGDEYLPSRELTYLPKMAF